MVGPSSSHTAGAVRLALLARNIVPGPIGRIVFTLYNSFAKTYSGHGTDRGLLAGILGMPVDDEAIKDAFDMAEAKALNHAFVLSDGPNAYPPNTVAFCFEMESGDQIKILGHSLGGGKVYISKIDDYVVSLRGEYPTLVMFYQDQPGMIWQVTKIIAEEDVNIASLTCTRREKGTEAFMSICLDSLLPQPEVDVIRQIPGVFRVHNVDKIMD